MIYNCICDKCGKTTPVDTEKMHMYKNRYAITSYGYFNTDCMHCGRPDAYAILENADNERNPKMEEYRELLKNMNKMVGRTVLEFEKYSDEILQLANGLSLVKKNITNKSRIEKMEYFNNNSDICTVYKYNVTEHTCVDAPMHYYKYKQVGIVSYCLYDEVSPLYPHPFQINKRTEKKSELIDVMTTKKSTVKKCNMYLPNNLYTFLKNNTADFEDSFGNRLVKFINKIFNASTKYNCDISSLLYFVNHLNNWLVENANVVNSESTEITTHLLTEYCWEGKIDIDAEFTINGKLYSIHI